VAADAILSPVAQAALAPRISAPVRKFYVQRGSHVKAGELLAVLENRDLSAAALDTEGSYTAAQAAYATATRAQVPEEYQKAQLDVAQAKANLDLNQSIYTSRKQLFEQGATPGRDVDTAQAALVQAQAAYDTATKHLESLNAVSREAALKSAQGQLTSAKAKYEGAEAQASYAEIRSPIAGVVTDRPLFAGETAAAGTPLITVMDTSALLAKVHLAQAVAQRLTVGSAATVEVKGIDDPLDAKVALISPALDPGSTTVEVWLRLENPAGKLKVGSAVHVAVAGRHTERALLVPQAALIKADDGTQSVMVIGTDGAAHKRAVTTGLADAGKVQVLSGLKASDTVITTGGFALEDGTRVKVGAAKDDAP
jgi:multidrug efflux pump subunit AcrA (membrane-fusion protein)